jgi:GrpB-like predicted nucleotidyltransferase (UPF0157 family)
MPAIEIVPYRPEWPAEFAAVARRLRAALDDDARRIDHIGSTSVPGLAAKDIVDVQVTVASLDGADLDARITDAGFAWHPYLADDSVEPEGMEASEFAKRVAADRAAKPFSNVHFRVEGRFNWRFALLFRDYLRATPDAAGPYAGVKAALATLHPDDKDAYYAVKDPVVALVWSGAEAWAAATGWTPGTPDA